MGEGRQRYADYCIKIFEHSTEEAKREKTDLNQLRSVGTSSSAKLYLLVRSRAPSVCTSVLNPKRPSDCNSGDPVKQSATPLEQLKGIVRMFASESGSRTVKEKLAVVYNLVVGKTWWVNCLFKRQLFNG